MKKVQQETVENDPADMGRVARINLAKEEHAALKAWEMSGEGERPPTPVMDWLQSQDAAELQRKRGNTTKAARSGGPRKPPPDAVVAAAIREHGRRYGVVVTVLRKEGWPLSGWFREQYQRVSAEVEAEDSLVPEAPAKKAPAKKAPAKRVTKPAKPSEPVAQSA